MNFSPEKNSKRHCGARELCQVKRSYPLLAIVMCNIHYGFTLTCVMAMKRPAFLVLQSNVLMCSIVLELNILYILWRWASYPAEMSIISCGRAPVITKPDVWDHKSHTEYQSKGQQLYISGYGTCIWLQPKSYYLYNGISVLYKDIPSISNARGLVLEKPILLAVRGHA